jgi:murein lipoprotein
MLSKTAHFAIALAAVAVLGGCATSGDLEALRDEINQANETAQSASANADAASREAAEAKAIAEEAKVIADEANSKIDNMFKKSMYK